MPSFYFLLCWFSLDPIEEEGASVLFSSVEEILKAAVMAEADILSEPFQLLMDSAKELSRKFSGLVPDGLYLPAPPLYCPQPAFLSEVSFFGSSVKYCLKINIPNF